jgi:hypothetical protein
MSCGIIYSATGQKYVAEAYRSALSSLHHNPEIQHIVFCDEAPPEQPPANLWFVPAERGANPYSDKIRNTQRSPFDRTIYLDTDTHVCGRITELFDLCQRFDIAAAHTPGYTQCGDPELPWSFYEFNTGVLVLHKTPAVDDFLRNWRETYDSWVEAPAFTGAGRLEGAADQPAFRRCLWNNNLRLCTLGPEYNYRYGFVGRLIGEAKIIHGRAPDFDKLSAALNAETGKPRVFREFPDR